MYNQQIYTFVQVVESGSFSKASEKLFISMVSIRKQINALENHINVKLLERTNQGVILTAAGRSIYEDAKKIIEASNISIKRTQK